MPRPQLAVVSNDATPPATALQFSEAVRAVVALSRRGGLAAPVFRSPPRREGVDRTIRRRSSRPAVIAVRRAGRPLPAVLSDVIEGVVVANDLTGERADRFRHAAWSVLQGAPAEPRARSRSPRAQPSPPDVGTRAAS
jgi:hypothetical protein